jgi:hypothetical protein
MIGDYFRYEAECKSTDEVKNGALEYYT